LAVVLSAALGGPTAAQSPAIPEAPARPQSAAPAPPALPLGAERLFGGVPTGEATAEPLNLSIGDAINRALAQNLGLLLAEDDIGRARGARWRALSDLLPNVTGRLSESNQKLNLAAYGFPLPPGIPPIVGPFNLFDARVYFSQALLDFRAINDAKAELHRLEAARFDYKNARDLVVLVTVDSYARALAASARVDAAQAQLQTAQALYTQALDLKQSGIVAGIDIIRAELQVDTERQLVTAAQTDLEKTRLVLARLIGLPIGQVFTLTDRLSSATVPDMTLEQALERAYRTRPDYQAALARVRAAEASRQSAIGELLPAVNFSGNYGNLGLSPHDAQGTFALVGAVDVPIFQGGRSRARLAEADAELRSRRADAEDLKASIYYDVRGALLDLQTGNQQLEVAGRARDLAVQQLNQARDRFAAGVAGNIEVVQAQSALTQANDQYIAAIYTSNSAKGALVRAVGIAEDTARQTFKDMR
jgi:outer membrane protein TolC